eukprot:TRINITY_DN31695_c0_g2_i1.p1 TRINITY_DN31695_c0_g2~~TRINITY_DN31695_c0_g2_i1.p1  ORF type:complete len:422 (+),score=43.09 TRINITY_DN31695_c0_g2_i1:347-1612(+)
MNRYDQFIEECRNKDYPKGTYLENHHILPRHAGGSDEPQNLIKLSLEDHVKAHLIRYKVYKSRYDLAMTLFRKNLSVEAWESILSQNGIKTTALQKRFGFEKGQIFWNSEFQKEMAQRSVTSEHAMKMRGVGGKKGGRTRNLNRIIIQQDKYLFFHNDCETVCIFNCETGGDILRELNKVIPTRLQRVSQLLRDERKKLHGWSCKPLNDVAIPEKFLGPPKILGKRNSDPVKMKAAGKKAGKARHINKLICEDDRFEFLYNGQPLLCTLNCQTGGDIVEQLNLVKPNIRFKRVTPLLNGTRNIMSGWSCRQIESVTGSLAPPRESKRGRACHLGKLFHSSDKFEFCFEGQPKVCLFNCETGGDIVRELTKVVPNSKFKRVTALFKGECKTLYGWSFKKIDQLINFFVEDILPRSEATPRTP